MSWFITGDRRHTVLSVSDSGAPICHGEGRHDPKPAGLDDYGSNINHALLRRLQQSKCGWTIAVPTEAELHIDGGGEGLSARVQQSPDKSHGVIKFFGDSELSDFVGFVIVVPERSFFHIRRLLELVMLNDSLGYTIVVDFLGFRVPESKTDSPTWEEFIGGRPYFFEEASFSIGVRKDDA